MKTIFKSFKFRIYPNKEQEILLAKHFGACRFVFNHYLNKRKESYLEDKKSLNYYDNANDLTQFKKDENYNWLKEINSQSLQSSLRNLDSSYMRFFRKQSKFPRFKSKYDRQSFKIPQSVSVEKNQLLIPKFKGGIRINLHREIEGNIQFATISKSTTGNYYVSLTCEVQHQPYEKTNSMVGIDTGTKDLAILSDGTTYENIKTLKNNLKKLKYNQRQLSKKVKGSSSRNKQRKNLAVIHEKITNVRKDYLHKVSTEIVKNHDIISVEDLAVKNIMKNHKLAQAMSDVSLGSFYSMLEYKCEWNDKQFVKIDRFFPSSKMCSNCGWINQDLTLKDREWTCPSCGEKHDRDFNASKNILKQGLKIILSGSGIESDIKQKQVEALSLDESMKPETH
ncbi:IS200/IS605 family element RNA-guided endonuclease TnpB [Trichloromonas sp.]|uniref:IS200/IS605 family element RNA-guided endonuclease TnpB n=1 Tax=Trichloromonas sp. TaxID=3069249 RepID=UPI002A45C1EA|nr:IS200/IS605 family element RNA-guided endonuclease TnpB [Trichloromonas sp.]